MVLGFKASSSGVASFGGLASFGFWAYGIRKGWLLLARSMVSRGFATVVIASFRLFLDVSGFG